MVVGGRRLWERVVIQLEGAMARRDLVPGDRLPGERILAESLGLGRSSVREALRVLESMGVLRARTGSGEGAGAIVVSDPEPAFSALTRMHLAVGSFARKDIVATRRLLEEEVVANLALTAPEEPDVLGPATEILREMTAAVHTAGELALIDTRFRCALGDAARNPFASALLAATFAAAPPLRFAGVDPRAATPLSTAAREHVGRRRSGLVVALARGARTEAISLLDPVEIPAASGSRPGGTAVPRSGPEATRMRPRDSR